MRTVFPVLQFPDTQEYRKIVKNYKDLREKGIKNSTRERKTKELIKKSLMNLYNGYYNERTYSYAAFNESKLNKDVDVIYSMLTYDAFGF